MERDGEDGKSAAETADPADGAPGRGRLPPLRYDLIELLFFAYRDFVGEADRVLEEFGFGRAHHRVVHFVDRNPGLRVSDLLAILKITKQSLGRVLRQLVEEGYVEVHTGRADRREKLLYTTETGQRLARRLATLQSRRIEAALDGLDPGVDRDVAAFLIALINREDRAEAAARIGLELPGERP